MSAPRQNAPFPSRGHPAAYELFSRAVNSSPFQSRTSPQLRAAQPAAHTHPAAVPGSRLQSWFRNSRGPQEKAGYLGLNSRRHSGLWLCLSGTGLFSSISERRFSLLSVTQGQTSPRDTKEWENRLSLTSKNRREGR